MAQVPPLVPDTNIPGITAALDRRRSGVGAAAPRFLCIGPVAAAAALPLNTPTLVGSSVADAEALCGKGTPIPEMVAAILRQYPKAECWIATPGNPQSAAAASKVITFAAAPTAAGTWAIEIGGRLYLVPVAKDATVTAQADALEAAIEADADAVVGIDNTAGACTITAKFPTAVGDGILIVLNPGGPSAGHLTPAGGVITELATTPYLALATGGTVPSIDTLITAMADDDYDVVVSAFHDTTSTGDLDAEVGVRRWTPMVDAPLGHWFTAKRDTATNLHAWGDGIGSWHALGVGVEPANPTSPWVHAADWAGYCGSRMFIRQMASGKPLAPHMPVMGVQLLSVQPTLPRYRFSRSERDSLVDHGVATYTTDTAGRVKMENEVSTEAGSYIQEAACAMAWSRYRRERLWAKFMQKAIVDDTVDPIPAGSAAPRSIKAEILSLALDALSFGWLRNYEDFKNGLVVEPNATNKNRIDVLETPRWANQLRQLGIVLQPLF
ncbi:MAG TPA: hypothetical protein PKY70_14585 [Nakamurella multipartita]|nr:hypothetical protein [Nakamurella multipartita]